MITILIPMGGRSLYEISGEFSYPKILNEINKRTLFEYSQDVFATLKEDAKHFFLIPHEQDTKLGLSSIINLVTEDRGKVITLTGDTQGALCSCLLAVDHFNPDDEIIISSADHFIDIDAQDVINEFRSLNANAGVLTFESLHPKWSYVKKDKHGHVVESAEKKAISREAIAGFFYFKSGHEFIEAAKSVIRKGGHVNGEYYISSCLNEIILCGSKVVTRPLKDHRYYNFYDNHAINSFSSSFNVNEKTKKLANHYIDFVSHLTTHHAHNLFTDDVVLVGAGERCVGKNNVFQFFKSLKNGSRFSISDVNHIYINENTSVIEYLSTKGGKPEKGVDVIEWTDRNKISCVRRYLNNV